MPNTPVDVDSWGVSACYPRRTFYPLSDGPSIWNPPDHYDRLSSLLEPSLSQSGWLVPLHSKHLISDQIEPTIARLRYSLGGDRPSQTTHHAGSPNRLHDSRLDIRDQKGGISRLLPSELAPGFHKLPPILHIQSLIPLQSCSKGARGLSV